MKTESDYNAALGKAFKTKWPKLFHIKCADKFTAGISDFLIYYEGMHAGLEVKFVNELPSDRSLLLKHPFEGSQLTFMTHLKATGGKTFGLVGIKQHKAAYMIPSFLIPEIGNWKTGDFFNQNFMVFDLLDISHILGEIFGRTI
jgi:penicillin-binding protein-related factor A (putative recombinase)